MRYVCLTQGIYFMLAGVWPLVNIHSFEVITGPKVDVWLVKTVGLLVAVIGAVLLLSGAGATSRSRSSLWPPRRPWVWRGSIHGMWSET